MLTCSRILVLTLITLLPVAVAQAKVAPAIDARSTQGGINLQKMIDELPEEDLCRVEFQRANNWARVETREPFAAKGKACPLPAPQPSAFEHFAQLNPL